MWSALLGQLTIRHSIRGRVRVSAMNDERKQLWFVATTAHCWKVKNCWYEALRTDFRETSFALLSIGDAGCPRST